LSGFLAASFAVKIIKTAIIESDKVSHASASSAIDPVTIPAQSFAAKRPMFTTIFTIPLIICDFSLFMLIVHSAAVRRHKIL
jgi:hypothetical protein